MESSTLRRAQGRLWYVTKQRLAWSKMHERGVAVTGVCQHYGISRKSFYNTQRPHSALAWLTPLQKLRFLPTYQRVTHA